VGMGGTFDHLHKGHKLLIKTALSISNNLVIGLTTRRLLKNKNYASKLEDYETREKNLKKFISSFTDLKRVKIIELNEPYGPPINDPKYEGLVVSQDTYPNALKMNEIREKKGFEPMIIITVAIIKDEDNKKLSSTSIRKKLK